MFILDCRALKLFFLILNGVQSLYLRTKLGIQKILAETKPKSYPIKKERGNLHALGSSPDFSVTLFYQL